MRDFYAQKKSKVPFLLLLLSLLIYLGFVNFLNPNDTLNSNRWEGKRPSTSAKSETFDNAFFDDDDDDDVDDDGEHRRKRPFFRRRGEDEEARLLREEDAKTLSRGDNAKLHEL